MKGGRPKAGDELKKKNVTLKSSYVIASAKRRAAKSPWLRDYLVWETSRPYLYIRSTPDGRIIVGGEDVDIVAAKKRDALTARKSRTLQRKFSRLVGDGGFALGFGGNGISFGMIAANAICQLVLTGKAKDQKLFSFGR